MKIKSALFGAALAAMTLSGGAAMANIPGWEFSDVIVNSTNNTWDFATNFTTSGPINIDALGYYDNGQLTTSHEVALYSAGGTLLASATVTPTDPIVGHFRYASISLLSLAAGSYQVAGVSGPDNYTWNTNGFHTLSGITITGNSWQVDTNPTYLNFVRNNVSNGYWGPNISVVPETSTWAMMLAGFAGLGFIGYRRNKVASIAA